VRGRAVEEAGTVEEPNRRRRAGKQDDQLARAIAALNRRPQTAQHQHEPQHEPDEEGDLPGAAEVEILVALMTKPEAGAEAEVALHGQPLAGQRAEHDDDQRTEQHVHAQALILGLASADGWRQE